MKDERKYLGFIIILAIFSVPSLVNMVTKLLVWLVKINFDESPLSITGQIVCRVLSFAVSFCLVGAIFQGIGWFNSKAMRIAYFFVSLAVSFVLSYIIMVYEQHTVLFCVMMAVVTAVAIAVILVCRKSSENKHVD